MIAEVKVGAAAVTIASSIIGVFVAFVGFVSAPVTLGSSLGLVALGATIAGTAAGLTDLVAFGIKEGITQEKINQVKHEADQSNFLLESMYKYITAIGDAEEQLRIQASSEAFRKNEVVLTERKEGFSLAFAENACIMEQGKLLLIWKDAIKEKDILKEFIPWLGEALVNTVQNEGNFTQQGMLDILDNPEDYVRVESLKCLNIKTPLESLQCISKSCVSISIAREMTDKLRNVDLNNVDKAIEELAEEEFDHGKLAAKVLYFMKTTWDKLPALQKLLGKEMVSELHYFEKVLRGMKPMQLTKGTGGNQLMQIMGDMRKSTMSKVGGIAKFLKIDKLFTRLNNLSFLRSGGLVSKAVKVLKKLFKGLKAVGNSLVGLVGGIWNFFTGLKEMENGSEHTQKLRDVANTIESSHVQIKPLLPYLIAYGECSEGNLALKIINICNEIYFVASIILHSTNISIDTFRLPGRIRFKTWNIFISQHTIALLSFD